MQSLVRIEIHDEKYEALHVAMEAAGFYRILTNGNNNKKYHAPTGTYWTERTEAPKQLSDIVVKIATDIDPNAQVVLSSAGETWFYNCREELPMLPPLPPISNYSALSALATSMKGAKGALGGK